MILISPVLQPFIDSLNKLKDLAPRLLELVIIIVAGLIVGWIFKLVVRSLLNAIKFNIFSYRMGFSTLLSKANISRSPTDFISVVFYWLIIFWFFLVGLSALNLPAVDEQIGAFFGYLPHIFVAILVVIFGYLLSQFISRAVLIGLVNLQMRSARMISLLVQLLILILFMAMAIEQLKIARGIVVATFSMTFGGVILALAIAFGLGGKDIAKDFLEKKLKSSSTEKKSEPDELSHL